MRGRVRIYVSPEDAAGKKWGSSPLQGHRSPFESGARRGLKNVIVGVSADRIVELIKRIQLPKPPYERDVFFKFRDAIIHINLTAKEINSIRAIAACLRPVQLWWHDVKELAQGISILFFPAIRPATPRPATRPAFLFPKNADVDEPSVPGARGASGSGPRECPQPF